MRLSGLLVVSILLCSAVAFSQHGGGGGGSHGSSSGGSSFASSAGFSHGTSTLSSHSVGTTRISSAKTSAKSERKAVANKIVKPSFGCAKGQNCTCPGGTRNAFGGCTPTPKIASCSSGVWNGYSCGAEGWFNDCRQLADQVSLQQRQLNRNGIRDGLRFRLLEDQYDYCQRAFRGTLFGFGLEE